MDEVLVAGHICVDLFPQLRAAPEILPGQLTEVGPLDLAPGGCVANTGLALAGLGVPVRMAADVGDDFLGRQLLQDLSARGVDAELRTRPGASTSYSIVIQPPGGERTFWHHAGANQGFDGSHLRMGEARILHVGYPPILPAFYEPGPRRLLDLFNSARDGGVLTSMDLATVDRGGPSGAVDWRSWLDAVLPATDVFTPSIDDLRAARIGPPGASLSELGAGFIAAGPAVALIKLGDRGLYLRTGSAEQVRRALGPGHEGWVERELWAPPLVVNIASTTGAGDSAAGGLLFGIASGWPPERALRVSAAAAASRIEAGTVDAWPALQQRLEAGWAHVELTEPGWTEAERGVYALNSGKC